MQSGSVPYSIDSTNLWEDTRRNLFSSTVDWSWAGIPRNQESSMYYRIRYTIMWIYLFEIRTLAYEIIVKNIGSNLYQSVSKSNSMRNNSGPSIRITQGKWRSMHHTLDLLTGPRRNRKQHWWTCGRESYTLGFFLAGLPMLFTSGTVVSTLPRLEYMLACRSSYCVFTDYRKLTFAFHKTVMDTLMNRQNISKEIHRDMFLRPSAK